MWFLLMLNSLKNKQSIFEMRFGHVCLSKNDFPKKNFDFFLSLFLLSLATQSLKIIFSSFHPRQGSPPHWGLVHYFSISISFVSLGATLLFISFVSHIGG